MTPEAARGPSYGLRVPETLSQQFLDAAATRLRKVTPRRVRVRAWTGSSLLPADSRWPEPSQRNVLPSPPLVEPWEPEPPEQVLVWIELRRRRFLFPEREVHGFPLADTNATEVLEDLLREVQGFMPDRVRPCEARVEIGSEEIRWWYERDGEPVLELEPLPLDLLPDDSGEGEGGAGVREPRGPMPNAPSAEDAIDPAA
jgi:hypothetical protein